MRILSASLLMIAAVLAPQAMSTPAPVYRCMVDGVPSYVSKPAKGHRCRVVPHAPPPPTPVLPPPTSGEELEKTFPGFSRPSERPPQASPGNNLPPLPPLSLPPKD